VRKREAEKEKKIEHQNRLNVVYQTACVAYANWPGPVFGFLGATADVGAADVTAIAGFPSIDPWLWL
jgi:hypothetical protein